MTNLSTDLPPYSGTTPVCPKCGEEGARTEYLAWGVCHHEAGMVLGMERNERLHRECDNCSHMWDEATVEQKPSAIKGEM